MSDHELKVVDLEPPPRRRRWPIVPLLKLAIPATIGALVYASWASPEPAPKRRSVREVPPQPVRDPRTGSLTLESVPNGAVIYLDGKPMQLPGGDYARTPSDLHSLQYGTRYRIELEKEGYQRYSRVIRMGAATDKRTIRPDLSKLSDDCKIDPNAQPGYLTIGSRITWKVSIDDEPAGLTPIFKTRLAAGCHRLRATSQDGRTKDVRVKVRSNLVSIYRLED